MRTYYVTVNGRELTAHCGDDGLVLVEGKPQAYEVKRISRTEFSVKTGTQQMKVIAAAGDEGYDVIAGDIRGRVNVESDRERLLRRYVRSTAGLMTRLEVHAPMPAMVIKLEVGAGDDVKAGQPLVVLEAMKMENEILAPRAGRVRMIYAIPGKPVEKGELLLLFE